MSFFVKFSYVSPYKRILHKVVTSFMHQMKFPPAIALPNADINERIEHLFNIFRFLSLKHC